MTEDLEVEILGTGMVKIGMIIRIAIITTDQINHITISTAIIKNEASLQ